LYIRSIFSSDFVPPVNVQSAFAELKGQWKTSFPVMTNFFSYVSRTYVGSRQEIELLDFLKGMAQNKIIDGPNQKKMMSNILKLLINKLPCPQLLLME
jgi:hypothetical protein